MNAQNLRVLVTGGAGFIGNEVARQLVALGAQVTVVDNFVNGKDANLADIDPQRLTVARNDIRDEAAMAGLIKDRDLILHLACLGVRHSLHAPLENHAVNATATLALLELARNAGIKRFVYVSSSEIYGTARTAPMTEEHPQFPMTVYGAAKLAGERYTDAYWRTWRFPTTVIRPFNAFGPRSHHEGDSGEVIPKFMLRAMAGKPLIVHGDGTQTRDFTFVADTARGIIEAALHEGTIGETLNLGNGREVSVNDLANLIARVLPGRNIQVEHGPDRPGDVRRLIADSSKAQRLFGFKPRITLQQGLEALRDWYLGSGQNPDDLLASERPINWDAPAR
ncbi:GDP-mannose 4,6-dehydratase [Dongia sp.]|uniref:GDP-mannose 4,6-dehydratase n=1 Tax=Dongia sp. TaxID=1977262 RepID=UPI0035B312C4